MAFDVNAINQNTSYSVNRPKIERSFSSLGMQNTHQSTGDVGEIIPVFIRDLVPGSKFRYTFNFGAQFAPFVSNLFHEINADFMFYFVPYRLLDKNWEDFSTGGKDGTYSAKLPKVTFQDFQKHFGTTGTLDVNDLLGTFWDYAGFPVSQLNGMPLDSEATFNADAMPMRYPFEAYKMIWNDCLRWPDLDDELGDDADIFKLQRAHWDNNYFTRSRIYQQRGVTPSVPVSDQVLKHVLSGEVFDVAQPGNVLSSDMRLSGSMTGPSGITSGDVHVMTGKPIPDGDPSDYRNTINFYQGFSNQRHSNRYDISIADHELSGLSFSLNDFLYSVGIMRYQVNNMRMRPWYIDQLKYRFGVYPEDARFQRPEYLGGYTIPISIDTVTQTAPAQVDTNGDPVTTSQGNITSQAWSSGSRSNVVDFDVPEHGVFMVLMTVRPKMVIESGMPRMWMHETRFDFPIPELENTPDVPLYASEVFWSYKKEDAEKNKQVFSWIGIYDEYRTMSNTVSGRLRPSVKGNLVSYTLAEYFEDYPQFNADFVRCEPDMARIKQFENEPDFIFFLRSDVKQALPLAVQSEPAMLGGF